MDVFRVRDQLIEDYRDFTGSFVEIHDKRIAAHVAERMDNGYQWPDPWLSLNPGVPFRRYLAVAACSRLLAANPCQAWLGILPRGSGWTPFFSIQIVTTLPRIR